MSDRPNIVYVFTDQQTAGAMSCAGNADLQTPAMDELAARGVRLERTYCTFPLCTPSRISMLTGRMPAYMGITGNAGGIPAEIREHELGQVMRRAGYATGYVGKWHAGGGIALPDPEADDHGFEKLGGFDDNAIPGACDAFFARQHDRPFFLVAAFDNPHNICEHGRDQLLPWGEVEDAHPGDYPNLPANFPAQPLEPEMVAIQRQDNPKIARDPVFTLDRWRKYRHVYNRLVEMVDAQLAQILDSLKRHGHLDNTLVIFSSDHGEMAGSHQLGHKQVHYEESIRVPMIVAGPGVRQGVVDDRLVSNGLDLLPTLCDYAGVQPPAGLLGRSLRPVLEGADVADWREIVVVETSFGGGSSAAEARIVVAGRHKYVCYTWGQHREQLYDLDRDPGEMVNLAVEPRHAPLLQRFREHLRDWCVAHGDTFGSHYGHKDHASIPGIGFVPVDR